MKTIVLFAVTTLALALILPAHAAKTPTLKASEPPQAVSPEWMKAKAAKPAPKAKTASKPKSKPKAKAAPKSKTKQQVARKKKKQSSKRPTPRRPVPALLAQPSDLPLDAPIPKKVITLIHAGQLEAAARRLYVEPASKKSLFLIREMQRIGEEKVGLAPDAQSHHRRYLNLGIAYHNLYLFLKAHDLTNKTFLKEAQKFYGKARKHADRAHRAEAAVLAAALDMAAGKRKAAERSFAREVDPILLESSFAGAIYLASYYAAAEDVEQTIAMLRVAQQFDTSDTLPTWLAISDDFAPIRNKVAFQSYMAERSKPQE